MDRCVVEVRKFCRVCLVKSMQNFAECIMNIVSLKCFIQNVALWIFEETSV